MKVYSFTEKKEKKLSGDIVGKFTTDPRKAHFYISEILVHILNAFPLSARLFLEDDDKKILPDVLTKNPVTIVKSSAEESVVGILKEDVLSHDSSISKKDPTKLVELPVVPDLWVSVVPEDQIQLNTIEVLYADTQSTWKDFVNPSNKIPTCVYPAICSRTPLQNKLMSLCRRGEEASGCTIEAPPLMKKDLNDIQGSPDKNAYQVLIDGTATASTYTQPNRRFSSSNSSLETTQSNSTTTTTTEDSDFGGRSMDKGSVDPNLEAFEKVRNC